MKLHFYFKAIFVHYQGARRGKNRIFWSFRLPPPQDSHRATGFQAGYKSTAACLEREPRPPALLSQRELTAHDAKQSYILAVLHSLKAQHKDSSGTEMASPALCPALCALMSPGDTWQLPQDSTPGSVSPSPWSQQPAPGTQAGVCPTARAAAPPGTQNLAGAHREHTNSSCWSRGNSRLPRTPKEYSPAASGKGACQNTFSDSYDHTQ